MTYIDEMLIAYSFPDGVMTEETANLSKGHWPLPPGVLPTREVLNGCPIANHCTTDSIPQLPVWYRGGRGGRERERGAKFVAKCSNISN